MEAPNRQHGLLVSSENAELTAKLCFVCLNYLIENKIEKKRSKSHGEKKKERKFEMLHRPIFMRKVIFCHTNHFKRTVIRVK